MDSAVKEVGEQGRRESGPGWEYSIATGRPGPPRPAAGAGTGFQNVHRYQFLISGFWGLLGNSQERKAAGGRPPRLAPPLDEQPLRGRGLSNQRPLWQESGVQGQQQLFGLLSLRAAGVGASERVSEGSECAHTNPIKERGRSILRKA